MSICTWKADKTQPIWAYRRLGGRLLAPRKSKNGHVKVFYADRHIGIPRTDRTSNSKPEHLVLGSVSVWFSVFEEIWFLENRNQSVLKKFSEPIISVFSYFGSVPILTELIEIFQMTSRQH
jgi:hypothetical protein